METLTTFDAAKGMQRKHSKLMRDLDRVRSLLPLETRDGLFRPVTMRGKDGKAHRAYLLTRDILPFLCMGQASRKQEVLWMAEAVKFLG